MAAHVIADTEIVEAALAALSSDPTHAHSVSPTAILEPRRDRHIGASGMIGVMAPGRDRHNGATR
jgi:hypothetical protein